MFTMALLFVAVQNYLHLYNPLYLGLSGINLLDVLSILRGLYDVVVKRCVFKFR